MAAIDTRVIVSVVMSRAGERTACWRETELATVASHKVRSWQCRGVFTVDGQSPGTSWLEVARPRLCSRKQRRAIAAVCCRVRKPRSQRRIQDGEQHGPLFLQRKLSLEARHNLRHFRNMARILERCFDFVLPHLIPGCLDADELAKTDIANPGSHGRKLGQLLFQRLIQSLILLHKLCQLLVHLLPVGLELGKLLIVQAAFGSFLHSQTRVAVALDDLLKGFNDVFADIRKLLGVSNYKNLNSGAGNSHVAPTQSSQCLSSRH